MTWRRPGGRPSGPSHVSDQPACKPGSVWRSCLRVAAIPLGRSLPNASSSQPERRSEDGSGFPCRSYSALLLVGFAVPLLSPGTRCALTAPFHPYRWSEDLWRYLLCGTFPGVAPAGRYPAPYLRGARTFLDALGTAAARPTDSFYMGPRARAVKKNGADVAARANSS
jgi:hypothetical protein